MTPEEIVRQKIIQFLKDELKVPQTRIEIEIPMCYFEKGARGRADIIIYGDDGENNLIPVLVIECKAPNVPLTDDVYEQVVSYNKILSADFILITNGKYTYAWAWNDNNQEYIPLRVLPEYIELITKQNLKYDISEPMIWERPSFSLNPTKEVVDSFMAFGWVGEETDQYLYPFLINLIGFIQDDAVKIPACVLNGINIIEDGGTRFTTFGNAAGGSWTGDYRYFIIEDNQGNNQILSVSIFGALKCENHPKFGNRKGHTALVVAIDDFDKRHNSLQLNLDKYTVKHGNYYTIWHDGTLTAGNKGAVKREVVLDFIRRRSPELIDNGKINLGTFDGGKEILWQQCATREFLGRLLKYALVRDEFRQSLINN